MFDEKIRGHVLLLALDNGSRAQLTCVGSYMTLPEFCNDGHVRIEALPEPLTDGCWKLMSSEMFYPTVRLDGNKYLAGIFIKDGYPFEQIKPVLEANLQRSITIRGAVFFEC